MKELNNLEASIFKFINNTLAAPWLNQVTVLLREGLFWIPLYIALLVYFYVKAKPYLLAIFVMTAVCFAITDFTSASIFKPWIGRVRPCHNNELDFVVNNIIGCGGRYSMPSSHASNHFGLATFWFLMVRYILDQKWYWLFIWALAIGFSQVYVGVHYPGDIAAGALLGIVVGILVYQGFKKWHPIKTTGIKAGTNSTA